MKNLIETLRSSDNEILKAEAKSIGEWGRLKHTKADLELMLTYNIVELRYLPEGKRDYENLIVTGNKRFINVYRAAKPKDKAVQLRINFNEGLKTKEPKLVRVYDMRAMRFKMVRLDSWNVVNFMPITEANVLILDKIVNKCLRGD